MDHGQRQPGLEDEYDEIEDTSAAFAYQAAREEEARHRRYVEATRMRSGEVQGYYFGDVPAVPDAIERADPALMRRGNENDMLHRGPSLEDLLAHKDSTGSTGSSSAVVLTPPLAPGELAPAGVAAVAVQHGGRLPCIYEAGSVAASFSARNGQLAAGVPAGAVPVRVDPQGMRAEPLEATAAAMAAATTINHMHSGAGAPRPVAAAVDMHTAPAPLHPSAPFHHHQQHQRRSGSIPSSPTSPSSQPTSPNQVTATRRPSEKLGSSLAASERERAELTAAADASTQQPNGRNEGAVARSGERVGATGAGAAAAAGAGRVDSGSFEEKLPSEVLSDLSPAHQMVLEFKNVCSWVQVGNYASAPKKPLKEQLKPSNLASACFKPVKDTFKSAAGAGRSAGAAAGGAARKLGGIVHHRGKKGEEDIETGKVDHKTLSGAQTIPGYRQILYNVTGHVKPGEVLALMGPSGSGKTSVLSILGGRAPKGAKLEGQLLVNGVKMTKAMRRRVGFVLQDDVLYETLTVQETLQYAGLLRLPKTMPRAEKMARVDAVMAVLGLTKSKDTIIGGYFRRGVSGGERKRVSVGHELLINPAVLMLDEPTSGLDSTTALHLVSLLKDLARGGRAILTTIHQPSSRLYRQLDKVMLLAEGHVMYYGDALRAVDWFDHLGFGLPYGTNLADHILDCAMGEVTYDPSAPGAHQQSGEQEGRDVVRRMHGPVAVKSLYQTFEAWFATHPEGFSAPRRGGNATTKESAPRLPGNLSHSNQESYNGKDEQQQDNNQDSTSISSVSSAYLTDMLGDLKLQPSAQSRRSLQSPPGVGNNRQGAKSGAGPVAESTADSTSGSDVQRVTADGQPRLTSDGVVRMADANGVTNAQGGVTPHHVVPMGVDAKGSDTGLRMRSSSSGGSSANEDDGEAVQGLERSGASFTTQVSVLWQRAVKVRRFESLSGQNLMQLIVVAVITGLLWWQRGRTSDIAGGADITGLLFFEMLFVAFRSLFSSLFTFPNEFRMLSKERPSGMYKLSAYYAARTFADLPIEILLPTIFIVIVYWFGGLRPDAGAFFSNWAAVLLIVMVAQSWGLLIGGLFMDPKLAQTMTTIIILTFMLVGGFYVKDVPVWIGWLKYLSFVYWGFNLLLKIEFRGRTFHDCTQPGPIDGCAVVPSIQDALRLPVNPNASVWLDVVVLLGMLLLLRWLTYMVLRWKTASSQRSL